jgi:hypothetical protein
MRIALTPKPDFLSDKTRASAHQDIMASPAFKAAASAAMLQMQIELRSQNLGDASIHQIMLKGAEKFLSVLMNIGEPDKPGVATAQESLNPV